MNRLQKLICICVMLFFVSCEKYNDDTTNSASNLQDFEAAWKRVKDVYPYLEYKSINWDSIYQVYKPIAEHAKGDEIFTVLVDMLGELRDGHVYVKTKGGEYMSTYIPRRRLKDQYAYSPIVVRNYFDKELILIAEDRIEYEILPGNIGYIYMATFDDYYLVNYFPEALNLVKHTKALILDIRHNNGGSYQNLVAVVSRFVTTPLQKPEFYVLGEQIPLEPFQPEGSFQYTNDVVVLINGVCYSSADIFPEIMSQIPTVTLLGDTTGGGSAGSTSSAPAEYELPSGKKIFVGTTDWRKYDGTPYEWVGVAPDILVPQCRTDIENGRDRQLEMAIQILSNN